VIAGRLNRVGRQPDCAGVVARRQRVDERGCRQQEGELAACADGGAIDRDHYHASGRIVDDAREARAGSGAVAADAGAAAGGE
jgi:hypothetical protein